MKINEIVYMSVEEVNALPRFDMTTPPKRGKWYLKPVAWALSFPETWQCHTKIRKHRMKGLKGGYLLLCNHNSFFDFKVATRAIFPHRANYIVAVDGFINREKLMRNVGCIGKRKFITDMAIIKQIKHSVITNNDICAIYPEARYSLVGTTSVLPDSLGKMIKFFQVPVVTLICHGNHLRQPVWNLIKRKVNTSADMTQLFSVEEIKKLSPNEINQRLRDAFYYDDYLYQVENNLIIDTPDRAEHLHKVLYQCPHCKVEHQMQSEGTKIWCKSCHKEWEMDSLGRLSALNHETEFSHIPDWYEWQRGQVRSQIEAGTYRVELEVEVDSLPNSTGFYRLGKGNLIHDEGGFHLLAKWGTTEIRIDKSVAENYSVHIEFDYFGKGNCVSFSMPNDTYYLFPTDKDFSVTKLHFAVEELFQLKVQHH